MAKYRVRVSQFCSLAKESKWQGWLQTIAPDLHSELIKHLTNSVSCKANQNKMTTIYQTLEERKLGLQVIKFLRKEYPHTLEEILQPQPILQPKSMLVAANTQEVFSYYKPTLLTFPQRQIFENNDIEALKKDVSAFLAGKVGGDYLIIGNRAYIEYFHLKYAPESKLIRPVDRELVKYRAKHCILQTEHLVPQK